MATIQDNSSILIYRVGPVLCCAPCLSVISITHPAPLTKLPGQKTHHSGIFKFGSNLVNVCELRRNFGVVPEQWLEPGRIIIAELKSGHVGFWVDEILDVTESPTKGWGMPPPLIPKATFSKTLTLNNEIHLYAEFENLNAITQIGYLKSYIEHLQKIKFDVVNSEPIKKIASTADTIKTKSYSHDINKSISVNSSNNNESTVKNVFPKKTITEKSNLEITPDSKPESLSTLENSVNINIIKPADINSKIENKTIEHKIVSTRINTDKESPLPDTITKTTKKSINESKSSYSYSSIDTNQLPSSIFIIISVLLFLFLGGFFYQQYNFTTPVSKLSSVKKVDNKIKVKQPNVTRFKKENTKLVSNKKPGIVIYDSDKSITAGSGINEINKDTNYSADITKNPDGVTIELHTSISYENESTLNSEKEIIHIVVKGDTLWHIAKHYVDDPFRYPELARLSNIKNPNLIYPGNRVHIIQIFTHGNVQNE